MTKNSRTKNSTINLTAILISQVISTIMKFIVRSIFIYVLGTSYLGISGLFSNVLTMLSLAELGFDTAITYRLYGPIAEKDYPRLRVLMKFYRYVYLVVGLVILFAGLALIPLLPLLIKDYSSLSDLGINPVTIYLFYLCNSVSSYLFFAYRSSIIKAAQRLYIITIIRTAVTLVSQGVQIAILLLMKNYTYFVAVSIFFSILTSWIGFIVAKKMFPEVFSPTKDRISKAEIKDIFKDIGAVFFAKINGVVLKGTDNIILSAFIGITVVGLYSNYLMLYVTATTLLAEIYSATKASAGDLFTQSDLKTRYNFFKTMNFITIILYGTIGVGIAVISNEFIGTWIGKEYIIRMPFSILIGTEILFAGIKQNLHQIRNVSGLFRQMWLRPLVGVIVNLTVSLALVKSLGIFGVIIGTITADIVANFAIDPRIIYRVEFEEKWKVSEYYSRNIRYILELFIIGAGDFLLCKYLFTGWGWISVILHSMICAISVPTYMMIVYKKSDEAKYIRRKFKNIVARLRG